MDEELFGKKQVRIGPFPQIFAGNRSNVRFQEKFVRNQEKNVRFQEKVVPMTHYF